MSSSDSLLDALVIGAGVVGLATGRALARAGLRAAVVDAGPRIGEQGSTHNSGIIHAGLYYRHDSLKAELCVRGKELLYRYCRDRHIDHRRCGKLVVAVSPEESGRLEALRRHAAGNGVEDLEPWSRRALERDEPWLRADSALFSPSSGIVDTDALMQALLGDLQAAGGALALNSRVECVRCQPGDFSATLVDAEGSHEIRARRLVNAAGLNARTIAERCEGYPPACLPDIRFARGNYFRLRGRAPTDKPVYPLPEPGGLGIHLTVDLGGQALFGPDVEWTGDTHFRVNREREPLFYQAIRRYWPALPDGALGADYAGVRPKVFRHGNPLDDFLIQDAEEHNIKGLFHLFGIESPGLTACLALADKISNSI